MTPSLSIIIPTHNRPDTLKQCLEHVSKQTIMQNLEVIVVNDNAQDAETAKLANRHWPISIQFLTIAPCHQGTARNRGVEKATAPLTMFIGDDIFLAPDACEIHVQTHKKQRATSNKLLAVLGYTTWDPSLNITQTMKWLEKTGWQFGYNLLTPYQHTFVPKEMQHRFTYTSFVSLPTVIAQKFLFREDVTLYGWEDTLWGQDLAKAGIPLYYQPDAVALHHHLVTLDDSLDRIEILGKSLLHLTKVAPELDRKPTGWKLLAYRMLALLPTMRGKHAKAFLKGLEKY